MNQAIRELTTLVSGTSAIWVATHDYERARVYLAAVAKDRARGFHRWSMTEGLTGPGGDKIADLGPEEILGHIVKNLPQKSLVILDNFHFFMEAAPVQQAVLDTVTRCRSEFKTVVFVGPVVELPPVLEKRVYVYDLPLPDREELGTILRDFCDQNGQKGPKAPASATFAKLIEAARGLTSSEAMMAFALALARHKSLGEAAVGAVREAKEAAIKKSGLLDVVPATVAFEDLGGLEVIKEDMEIARSIITDPVGAREFGAECPKGVLLIGPPGTAKSTLAKAIARLFGTPLLRFDMGMIMNEPHVGVAENRIREALQTARAMAPVVVFFDEINMALSGSQSSGYTDSGVTSRIIQQLLTFMAENEDPVFFVAAANSLEGLPYQLTRKGRFDEIYLVDLPAAREREAIWRIHTRRRKIQLAEDQIRELASVTERFSGAEIEAVVKEAIRRGFGTQTRPGLAELLAIRQQTKPKAETDAQEYARLKDLAKRCAREASRTESGKPSAGMAQGPTQIVGLDEESGTASAAE